MADQPTTPRQRAAASPATDQPGGFSEHVAQQAQRPQQAEQAGEAGDRRGREAARPQAWTWLVPLVVAATVFSAVLLATPPGFGAVTDVLFSQPRGPNAEAAAYALGAAGALALVALLVLGGLCWLATRLLGLVTRQ